MEPVIKDIKIKEPVLRQLTERQYLGDGYLHAFQNDKTGEVIYVPCTQQEYERMGLEGGSQYNPTMDGYTWLCSGGGTIKVDTPNTLLGDDEFCIKDGVAVINAKGIDGLQKLPPEQVDHLKRVDEDLLKNIISL